MPAYFSNEQRAYTASTAYGGGSIRLRYCEDCGATILDSRAQQKHDLFHKNIDSIVEILGTTLRILENNMPKDVDK